MAKEDKGKVRMTVIHFETESSNESLTENIRNIAHTIVRSLHPPTRVSTLTPTQLTSGDGSESGSDIDDEDLVEGEVFPSSTGSKSKRAARRYTTPEILVDVDLTSGTVPFKDFLEQKKVPDNDANRYLAIAIWFKEHRDVKEITIDHIYTVYKAMGWSTLPKDVGMPLRNMKSKNGYFSKGSGRGAYALNHVGETAFARLTEA